MKIARHGKNYRKAISPVIATVILIAITLIAAVAIAGFVFGLFGSFTSSAQVLVTNVSCTTTGTCTLTLSNSGTANTNILASSFSISYAGTKITGNCAGGTNIVIVAGSATPVSCSFSTAGAAPVSGQQFVGSLGLANGGVVSFSGTFS